MVFVCWLCALVGEYVCGEMGQGGGGWMGVGRRGGVWVVMGVREEGLVWVSHKSNKRSLSSALPENPFSLSPSSQKKPVLLFDLFSHTTPLLSLPRHPPSFPRNNLNT